MRMPPATATLSRSPRMSANPKGFLSSRQLYDGWLEVERSMFDDLDDYTMEHLTTFAGGWIEVRKFGWSRPAETIYSTSERCYMFNMSLNGCNPANTVINLNNGPRNQLESMGRMVMVPPGQKLACTTQQGQLRSIRCMLDARIVESFLTDIPSWDWREQPLHDAMHLAGGQFEWLIRRMYREVQSPDFATASVLDALARQLAVEVVRKFKLRTGAADYRIGGLAPWRMRLIRERVNADAPSPPVEELAKLCDMTSRHLSRAFRTETGQTLGKYVETAMIDRANLMLRSGVAVKEVAATLGYATSSSFTAAFRRATGLLPREVKADDSATGTTLDLH